MEQSREEQQSREAVLWRNAWSCTIAFLALGFLGTIVFSMLVISWPFTLQLGPNSSILIKPIPLFMESIKVEEIDDANNRPTVYGFYEDPPLDVFTTFSEAYETSLPPNTHKDWTYYLNQGSQINISYSVNSSSSYSLVLIIARGSGTISQDIRRSSSYFLAVLNSNSGVVQVQLDIKIKASLYNTTGAYYECNFQQKECSLRFFFRHGNAALLTSPPQRPGTATGTWSIKVSYGHRWIAYLFCVGGMILLFSRVSWYYNILYTRQEDIRDPAEPMESQQTPFLSCKDDDLASWGSSYDDLSQDDEYNEGGLDFTAPQGRQVNDGEYNDNIRRLCAICFDAPRNCFFLPCGHCASCFECGTMIAEAAGTCPICRGPMKKVRRTYTV